MRPHPLSGSNLATDQTTASLKFRYDNIMTGRDATMLEGGTGAAGRRYLVETLAHVLLGLGYLALALHALVH